MRDQQPCPYLLPCQRQALPGATIYVGRGTCNKPGIWHWVEINYAGYGRAISKRIKSHRKACALARTYSAWLGLPFVSYPSGEPA